MYPPKIFYYSVKGCCQYLQQAFEKRKSKMGDIGEWERFGHSNFTLRIDVSNEEG
jgi:hypothetical protein